LLSLTLPRIAPAQQQGATAWKIFTTRYNRGSGGFCSAVCCNG